MNISLYVQYQYKILHSYIFKIAGQATPQQAADKQGLALSRSTRVLFFLSASLPYEIVAMHTISMVF